MLIGNMTHKSGIKKLREYIQGETKSCEINDTDDNFRMAVKNQQRVNVMILEDILRELESNSLKLDIAFSAPKANELPHLAGESFEEKGITIQGNGGIYQASVESMQSEFVIFWVSNIISIAAGSISIAEFIHRKLQNYKNAKIRVGTQRLSPPYSIEDIKKIVKEELERLKEEEDKKQDSTDP
ncbi:Putative phage protein [Nitrosotalea devaniterrae]|uniref:Phage protein n=1 Tax=Nitrosotalea devaniterrae TaxID=1078905 RepID=A0A128A623_9ARCH|nr:Putative phage protein [Candidatus Nitrosotalea devanaterra]